MSAPPGAGRWRRTRALLAAGSVLATGTLATTAAWTDQEVGTAALGASGFELESQSEGQAFTSHSTPPGSALAFGADAMVPGTSVFAWLNLRTTPTTTIGGTVRLASTDSEGPLTAFLQYRAVRSETALTAGQCTAATFTEPASVFIAGGPTQWEPTDDDPPAPAVFPIGPALDDLGICFEVRIDPATAAGAPGLTGTVTWGFTGIAP